MNHKVWLYMWPLRACVYTAVSRKVVAWTRPEFSLRPKGSLGRYSLEFCISVKRKSTNLHFCTLSSSKDHALDFPLTTETIFSVAFIIIASWCFVENIYRKHLRWQKEVGRKRNAQSDFAMLSYLIKYATLFLPILTYGVVACTTRPRSIYQYSSMAPRLSGQNC